MSESKAMEEEKRVCNPRVCTRADARRIVAHVPHAHVGCNVVQTLHQIEGQQCSMPEARPMAVSRVSSSIIAARGRRLGEVLRDQAAPVKTGKKTSGEPSTTVQYTVHCTVSFPQQVPKDQFWS